MRKLTLCLMTLVLATGACAKDDVNAETETDASLSSDTGAADMGGADDANTTGDMSVSPDTGTSDASADMGSTDTGPDAPTLIDPAPIPCHGRREVNGVTTQLSDVELDSQGRIIRRETDTDADGTPDSITTWLYEDSIGRVTTMTDYDADGTVDLTTVKDFDDRGREIRQESTTSTNTSISTTTYLPMTVVRRYDSDGDGVLEWVETSFLDAVGRATRIERDDGANGTIDTLNTYAYSGNVVTHETDAGYDGVIDYRAITETDDQGRLIRREVDSNADGTADEIIRYMWLDDGVTVSLRTEYDDNGDGTVDSIEVEVFDVRGEPLSDEFDEDADGIPETTTTWEYDAEGRLLRTEEIRSNGDTTINYYEHMCM